MCVCVCFEKSERQPAIFEYCIVAGVMAEYVVLGCARQMLIRQQYEMKADKNEWGVDYEEHACFACRIALSMVLAPPDYL